MFILYHFNRYNRQTHKNKLLIDIIIKSCFNTSARLRDKLFYRLSQNLIILRENKEAQEAYER